MTTVINGTTGLSVSAMPFFIGQICTFAMNIPPNGFVKCNGAIVSRITYAALFAIIGTAYGVGNGSTTFGLPDLRGEFIRGWDDSRGIDTNRAIGTPQTDAMQGHKHNWGDPSPVSGAGGGAYVWSSAPASGTSYSTTVPITDGVNGVPRTDVETRPRNIALMVAIFTGV